MHVERKLVRSALTQRPFALTDLPDGWLFDLETSILYNAALAARGAVIEVGAWIGRSSCCLAAGIRDNSMQGILYDIFDFGLASIEEWKERFNEDPLVHASRDTYLPVIFHPGGSLALLKKNIVDRQLGGHVNMLHFGDFKTSAVSRIYEVGFCDASHDEAEIELNVPSLMKMMRQDSFLLCFDDVWSENQAKVLADIVKPDILIRTHTEELDAWSYKFTICAKGDYARLPWLGG